MYLRPSIINADTERCVFEKLNAPECYECAYLENDREAGERPRDERARLVHGVEVLGLRVWVEDVGFRV